MLGTSCYYPTLIDMYFKLETFYKSVSVVDHAVEKLGTNFFLIWIVVRHGLEASVGYTYPK